MRRLLARDGDQRVEHLCERLGRIDRAHAVGEPLQVVARRGDGDDGRLDLRLAAAGFPARGEALLVRLLPCRVVSLLARGGDSNFEFLTGGLDD
jgi:hypothetical protein